MGFDIFSSSLKTVTKGFGDLKRGVVGVMSTAVAVSGAVSASTLTCCW